MLLHAPRLSNEAIDEDTDVRSQYFTTNFDQTIHRHYLDADEYLKKPGKNEYFFFYIILQGVLTHTAV